MQILIAPPGEDWPLDPSVPIVTHGLRDLGLNSGDGIEITDSDLRKHTRLAAYVSGDINGTIEVGQVQRIQAGNLDPFNVTGNINADITAIAPYSQFTQDAIGRIYAGNAIAGNITATGDGTFDPADTDTYASIGRIVVGPDPAAAGITGDIKAEKGRIDSIYTTGPIGSVSITPKIWAGNGILEIRASSEDVPETVLARDFKADIDAARDPGVWGESSQVHEFGNLGGIRTDGNLSGTVSAANVVSNNQGAILVKGTITAPITVKYTCLHADIIAASIEAPVTIGVRLKGSVIATDGNILSVEVGYANEGLNEEDEGFDPVAEEIAAIYRRGMVGTECLPVDPIVAAPIDIYTWEDWTAQYAHCIFIPFGHVAHFDGGAIDSVIRAPSIGVVRVAELSNFIPAGAKPYHARIESPEIGELWIGDLREGVVWSGNIYGVEGGGGPEIAWDPEDAYSSIGLIRIGRIGAGGDLWVDGATRVQVEGDVLGQIHVPTLTNTIWIGGSLGLWDASAQNALEDGTPRDTVWEFDGESLRQRGEIVIREVGGLQGQIIINGNNDGGTWDGAVIVGDVLGPGATSNDRIVITRFTDDDEFRADFEAPHYLSPSGPLGGGAVGLAPFAFYPTDCVPPHNHPDPLVGIITTAFETGYPVLVRWYGPVALPQEPPPPSVKSLLEVRVAWPFDECVPTPAVDLTSIFAAALHTDGKARTLGLGATVQPRGAPALFAFITCWFNSFSDPLCNL